LGLNLFSLKFKHSALLKANSLSQNNEAYLEQVEEHPFSVWVFLLTNKVGKIPSIDRNTKQTIQLLLR